MRYDTRFGYYGACYVTNDNGESSGGGNGNGGAKGGNDNKPNNAAKEPPWKSEFGDDFDPDKAWTTIQNQRRSERALTKAKEEAEAKVAEFENANKTEVEKLQGENEGLKKQLEALQTQLSQAAIGGEVANIAKRLGAAYPEDVYPLVSSKLEIKDGKATNIEEVVKELAEARPLLFQGSNIDQRKTNNGEAAATGDNASMNNMIRSGFGRR